MAAAGLIVLNAPDNAHRPPNTGDGSEFGDNWQAHVNSLNTMFAALFGGTGVANTIIAAGATKALAAADSGKTIALDTAAGSVVTLPTATGSGNRFKFFVKTLATSNSHIIYCHDANGGAGADNFIGLLPGARVDSTNALLAFAAPSPARAAAYVPPPIDGHVTDRAGKLSASEKADLEQRLEGVNRATSAEIAVLILPSLDGQTIEDVAYGTFNGWQLGKKGKDNGVLLVIAVQEHRVRIETGKGRGPAHRSADAGHHPAPDRSGAQAGPLLRRDSLRHRRHRGDAHRPADAGGPRGRPTHARLPRGQRPHLRG